MQVCGGFGGGGRSAAGCHQHCKYSQDGYNRPNFRLHAFLHLKKCFSNYLNSSSAYLRQARPKMGKTFLQISFLKTASDQADWLTKKK